MALKVRFRDVDTGDRYREAYLMVLFVKTNALDKSAEILIGIFRSAVARRAGRSPVHKEVYYIRTPAIWEKWFSAKALDGNTNPFARAYEYLKSLDEYVLSGDV